MVSYYALMPFILCVYQGSTWQGWEGWTSWRNWSKGLYWYSSSHSKRLNMFNSFLELWAWTIENIWQAHFEEATQDSKMQYYVTELHEKNMLVQNLLMESRKKVCTIVSSFMLIYAVFFQAYRWLLLNQAVHQHLGSCLYDKSWIIRFVSDL